MKQKLVLIILLSLTVNLFAQENDFEKLWKIDSVQIKKNWRTRDKIILRELQFKPGETIDKNCIETSINQIWNIGNFAIVDFSLDSISPEGYLMNIQAKDAFTLLPIISFSGSRNDYNLGLGISDNNFLGRNITLNLSGNIGTYSKNYNIGIEIPRQLLYKNMTLAFHALNGSGNNFRYSGDNKVSVVAYHAKQFSGSIGNPWNTDYYYTFSPNFNWNIFQHKTDISLIDTDVPFADNYEVKYLALSLGESIGMINRKRHQRDGYSVSAGYGVGIGFDKNSPFYQSFGLNAIYYKLFNPVIEFSAGYSTGYTTSTKPSLITYLGSGNVKGLTTGKESGQGYFSGFVKGSFTYLNRDWFALEQTIYLNFGKANDKYFDIYKSLPRISAGTGFKIWTPMIPWLAASVHFVLLKGGDNWFYLDI
jgi:outer membrane protein assembly factor BamA